MKRLSVTVHRRDGGTDRYADVVDLHVFGERLLVQLAAEDGDDPVVLYVDSTWTSVEVVG